MGEKGKFLVTKEGRFDLGTHMWDDQVFTDILVRDNPIDIEKAMGISRSLREEILRMERQVLMHNLELEKSRTDLNASIAFINYLNIKLFDFLNIWVITGIKI